VVKVFAVAAAITVAAVVVVVDAFNVDVEVSVCTTIGRNVFGPF
jgi:hypothetical protein